MNPFSYFCKVLLFCAFIIMTGAPKIARAQFEGIIRSENSTTDERGSVQRFTMTMFVRGDRVRIENSSIGGQPASTMIYRGDMKVVWLLNEEDKTYIEIRQDQQTEELRPPPGMKSRPPAVRKTGKKKTVLRYACDQIMVSGEGVETEIWATKSLGQVYATISRVLGGGSEPGGEEWENEIVKMGYFPLLASSKLGGKVVESQAVTAIERKTLEGRIFDLPDGFARQSLDQGQY